MSIEVREWDSRFFGYPVASVSFAALPNPASDIPSALQEARTEGIRLLYLSMPPVQAALRHAIEQAGTKSVGRKVEYSKPIHMPSPSDEKGGIFLCHENSPALEHLALQSGSHSRFHLDDGFQNQEFERLYREWLASSLRGENGKRVYVAGDATDPQGLITLEPGQMARIGLLAVDARQRGHGLGHQLVAEAERVCHQNHFAELHVATQAENTRACHFYEICGFRKISETEFFHAWL